ncbi:transcriptional regulator [Streptomyces niveiscabiei]|uniref:transcriptional regulator n=1 Tax=Streptomyces niveiscabiei TaxID=164115 RepID=UPI0029A2F556|nr:transcriptional regulator [Streptomyces niveiscabiei]MDX3387252.1 transcriptional regulator [Streptomyces niveiscabiei]
MQIPRTAPVRPLVADSWARCTARGVHAGGLPPLCGAFADLDERRRGHPLAAALPLLRDLLGRGAADDGHVFAVTDRQGTLLWVEGDPAALRRAERMRFVEGARWAERLAGTNAPGTALELGRAVQIVTGEHYGEAVHAWSCAAAPVRDPRTGLVLGAVDLSGGPSIATPPALAAVRAAALAAQAVLPRTPAGDGVVRLRALARDSAVLEHAGRAHRLSPRHSEIVVTLALEGRGVIGDRLAVDLSEHEIPPSTLRAELTRLRAVLGPGLLGSRPYALLAPVRADYDEVAGLLAEGRVDAALARYPGPLLPRSEAPLVVAHRTSLEQQLRGAVLAGGAVPLRRWVASEWGGDDASAWTALARILPGGSPQRAAAEARARHLEGAVGDAARLQRRRS